MLRRLFNLLADADNFFPAWGIGLTYIPSIVSVAEYFYQKRSFATGLAVCGAGVGTFTYAALLSFLLDEYEWRGTYLILSALSLNCSVCALIYRPLTSRPIPLAAESCAGGDELKEKYPTVVAESTHERAKWHSLPELYVLDFHGSSDVEFKENGKIHSQAELSVPFNKSDNEDEGSNSACARDGEVSSVQNLDGDGVVNYERKELKTRISTFLKQRCATLQKKSMLAWAFSAFFTGLSMPTIPTFLPDLAVEAGMTVTDAAFLISVAGIASTVSRAVLGWVAGKPCVNKPLAYVIITLIMGTSTGLCPFSSKTYILVVFVTAVHGTCSGELSQSSNLKVMTVFSENHKSLIPA